MAETLLELKHVTKNFGNTVALSDVSFDLRAGEVHALCGENGAGKSTLINILGGIHKPTKGQIFVDGKEVKINGPRDAAALGISVVHQELLICEDLTVAENIFLGEEFMKGRFLDKKAQVEAAEEALRSVDAEFSADEVVRKLSTANRQIVEITRAVSAKAKCVIFDEPTSSITEKDTENLFRIVKKLRENGVGIIYISHRLDEVFELADRVTVLRDGQTVGTITGDDINQETLVSMMVGRKLDQFYIREGKPTDEIALEVEGITAEKVNESSFFVKKGEIVGFAGMVGSGRTELMRVIYGIDPKDTGTIKVNGQVVNIDSPSSAVKAGIIYLPEDRKGEGLFLRMSVRDNTTITSLKEFMNNLRIDHKKEEEIANKYTKPLRLKATMDQMVQSLSGGNQQKVLMARWLNVAEKIIILDEPTRGIDVGAKADIYRILDGLAQQGFAIVMVSSELQEIVGMCDRVYVMRNHRIAGCVEGENITQVKIMEIAAGGSSHE
ncbi:MAG: sugar ABC transporter ATP-binding protein [Mogibacterium sp.]|nr:sugar ABC transporter ATP-binding protein [Mogibacterium sp.]